MPAIRHTAAIVIALTLHVSASAICTPASINPGAVQRIRPHMSPAAVSAVLGCPPTEISPIGVGLWVWGVPFSEQAGGKTQIAVVFDAGGVASAFFQFFPVGIPVGNGAIRVEPPPQMNNWISN